MRHRLSTRPISLAILSYFESDILNRSAMTRRQVLSAAALGLVHSRFTEAQQFTGMASRGITPAPRGKPSGLPFDAKFVNIAAKAGLRAPIVYGNEGHVDYILDAMGCGVAFIDYDADGWLDVITLTGRRRTGPTPEDATIRLYRNNRDGTFEDVSLISGAAVDVSGKAQSTMGVSTADFDHSGRLGIYITNFNATSNTLYWNQGEKGFTDISFASGLGPASMPYVAWGTAFLDMDNDGWVDLLVANGHVYPQADLVPGITPYRQPLMLFRNKRDRTFEDVSKIAGLSKLLGASWRGAAVGDVNNDGRMDILAMDVDGPPVLLINRTESADHAAMFRLIGTKSNKAAIGARITVTAGDLVQMGEVQGGSSYLSQNDLRLHFGLGDHATMDKLEILWPGGTKESYQDLPAGYIFTIVEGAGVQQKIPLTAGTASQP